ncbi:MAG: hypothetical protein ACYDHW_01010 [Syntrophorhabdaceae bacterium]
MTKLTERNKYRKRVAIRSFAYFVFFFMVSVWPVFAQQVFLNGGSAVNTDTGRKSSQGHWSVAYFQDIADYAGFSITYLNEGHQPDHARDGVAPQIWARARPLGRDVSFGVGAGPYLFFDTDKSSNEKTDILHGLGLIASGTVTLHSMSPFLLQFRANYIHIGSSYDSFTGSVGIGYLLDHKTATFKPHNYSGKNEIDFLFGKTVLNLDNSQANAMSVEYRRHLSSYLDWTIGWLHEGDSRPVGRYGVLSELWLVEKFYGDRLALGIGAGPYVAHDRYSGGEGQRDTLAGALSLTAAWHFTDHVGFRGVWHRIATDYDCDTDILIGGLALAF